MCPSAVIAPPSTMLLKYAAWFDIGSHTNRGFGKLISIYAVCIMSEHIFKVKTVRAKQIHMICKI